MIMEMKLQPFNDLLRRKWRIFYDSKFREILEIILEICLNRPTWRNVFHKKKNPKSKKRNWLYIETFLRKLSKYFIFLLLRPTLLKQPTPLIRHFWLLIEQNNKYRNQKMHNLEFCCLNLWDTYCDKLDGFYNQVLKLQASTGYILAISSPIITNRA